MDIVIQGGDDGGIRYATPFPVTFIPVYPHSIMTNIPPTLKTSKQTEYPSLFPFPEHHSAVEDERPPKGIHLLPPIIPHARQLLDSLQRPPCLASASLKAC